MLTKLKLTVLNIKVGIYMRRDVKNKIEFLADPTWLDRVEHRIRNKGL